MKLRLTSDLRKFLEGRKSRGSMILRKGKRQSCWQTVLMVQKRRSASRWLRTRYSHVISSMYGMKHQMITDLPDAIYCSTSKDFLVMPKLC